jgi:hypothetical protein
VPRTWQDGFVDSTGVVCQVLREDETEFFGKHNAIILGPGCVARQEFGNWIRFSAPDPAMYALGLTPFVKHLWRKLGIQVFPRRGWLHHWPLSRVSGV